jgi:hypothetical protein
VISTLQDTLTLDNTRQLTGLVNSNLYKKNHCQQFLMTIFNFNDNLHAEESYISHISYIYTVDPRNFERFDVRTT